MRKKRTTGRIMTRFAQFRYYSQVSQKCCDLSHHLAVEFRSGSLNFESRYSTLGIDNIALVTKPIDKYYQCY